MNVRYGICPYCNNKIQTNNKKCPICHHIIDGFQQIICPHCNNIINYDDTFCIYCGNKINYHINEYNSNNINNISSNNQARPYYNSKSINNNNVSLNPVDKKLKEVDSKLKKRFAPMNAFINKTKILSAQAKELSGEEKRFINPYDIPIQYISNHHFINLNDNNQRQAFNFLINGMNRIYKKICIDNNITINQYFSYTDDSIIKEIIGFSASQQFSDKLLLEHNKLIDKLSQDLVQNPNYADKSFDVFHILGQEFEMTNDAITAKYLHLKAAIQSANILTRHHYLQVANTVDKQFNAILQRVNDEDDILNETVGFLYPKATFEQLHSYVNDLNL